MQDAQDLEISKGAHKRLKSLLPRSTFQDVAKIYSSFKKDDLSPFFLQLYAKPGMTFNLLWDLYFQEKESLSISCKHASHMSFVSYEAMYGSLLKSSSLKQLHMEDCPLSMDKEGEDLRSSSLSVQEHPRLFKLLETQKSLTHLSIQSFQEHFSLGASKKLLASLDSLDLDCLSIYPQVFDENSLQEFVSYIKNTSSLKSIDFSIRSFHHLDPYLETRRKIDWQEIYQSFCFSKGLSSIKLCVPVSAEDAKDVQCLYIFADEAKDIYLVGGRRDFRSIEDSHKDLFFSMGDWSQRYGKSLEDRKIVMKR